MTAPDTRLAAGFKAAAAGLQAVEDDLRARADDVARMRSVLERHWIDLANPTSLSELLDRIGEPADGEAKGSAFGPDNSQKLSESALSEHSAGRHDSEAR